MKQEKRIVVFDEKLQIEAYSFNGIDQKFPNHFHEYYVIGFIENGCRNLKSKGKEYIIDAGDVVLLNPLDNHCCYQIDAEPMNWNCFNIKQDVMCKISSEIMGKEYLPVFNTTVIYCNEIVNRLKELHQLIINKKIDFEKEELFYFIIEELISKYTLPLETSRLVEVSAEIQKACTYIENNFAETINLDDLCDISGLKKYTLLRYFVRQKGVTPYQYLETIRIGEAKKLLEQGISPIESALQVGFSDQSHFTRFFKNYIGLTPKQFQDVFIRRDYE